jgi:hypothetical protein
VDANTPWRNLGIIGLRLVDLAGRYVLTYTVTWAAVDASLPADDFSEGRLVFFPLIGIPSLLVSSYYALLNHRTGAAFRLPLAGLLVLPTWFLLFQNFSEMLFIPVMGQLFFALCVMRVPLLGPSRLRRRARTALVAAPVLAGRLASRVRRTAPRA